MQVILLQRIGRLGQMGDVVSVKDGYAPGSDDFDLLEIQSTINLTDPKNMDKRALDAAMDYWNKGKKIYLQVGAYQKEVDADNMKAKLALLGVEANIQSVNSSDKGLLHRVRIGPLTRSEDVERLRGQLKANGLNPTPVKAD